MNFEKLTQKSAEAIRAAQSLAREHGSPQIEQLHLLCALLAWLSCRSRGGRCRRGGCRSGGGRFLQFHLVGRSVHADREHFALGLTDGDLVVFSVDLELVAFHIIAVNV